MAKSNGEASYPSEQPLFDKLIDSSLMKLLEELLSGLKARIEKLEQMLLECLNRLMGGGTFTAKDFYTPKEFAKIVDLKVETVREHLKNDRIEGFQTSGGRGGKPEWRVSHDELKRFWKEGLKPIPPEDRYRHVK